jgi:hypothetical protein
VPRFDCCGYNSNQPPDGLGSNDGPFKNTQRIRESGGEERDNEDKVLETSHLEAVKVTE